MTATLIPLNTQDCLNLLAFTRLGRIGVIDDGYPLVFPISFRLSFADDHPLLAIRTRPANVIDQPDTRVCLQIDGIDSDGASGWSVLARGVLRELTPNDEIDPHPLATDQRDAWRVIVPDLITGRRLAADPQQWTFNPGAYL